MPAPDATVAALRERMTEGLAGVLSDRYPRPAGTSNVYEDGIVVRSADLLAPCPAPVVHPADDYRDTTVTTARRIGRMGLRRWRPGRSPSEAVREALAELDDWPTGSLRNWLVDQDRATRAATEAASTTWATGALRCVQHSTALAWADCRPQHLDLPDHLVRLSAGFDASRRSTDGTEALLVVADSAESPADRLSAGLLALVRGTHRGRLPGRITFASPATGGSRRVEVTPQLVELAMDRVLEVLSWHVQGDPPVRPGRSCRWCHLLEDCDEGLALVAGPLGAGSTAAAG